jgi:ribosomal-protein-alanine N-acetyltransferase
VTNEFPLITPDPPLRHGSVTLRPFHIGDAAAVAEACRDSLIPRFTFMSEGLTEAAAREWIQRSLEHWQSGLARFAILDTESAVLLGQMGMSVSSRLMSAEAFYWVVRDARGRGVASTALGLLADWALDVVKIERLSLLTHVENQVSQGVAKHCGFTKEGVLRAYEPFKGTRPDMVSWSLLPADYRPWRTESG